MRYKSSPVFKAADPDSDSAEFEAIVSVFGNVDSWGDVVMPGAFADSLADWAKSGDPIPVLWSHRMDDPQFCIGAVVDAAEVLPGDERIPEWVDQWVKDHGGLYVKGRLDTGADASAAAVSTRRLLKDRRVKQFSFAYDIVDGGWGTANGEDAYELRKLKLYEVSPTPVGANDLTQLLGAKAAALVARLPELGKSPAAVRRLMSEMDEAELCDALTVIGKTLARTDGTPEGTPAKDSEPTEAMSAGLARPKAESIRRRYEFEQRMHELAV